MLGWLVTFNDFQTVEGSEERLPYVSPIHPSRLR